MTVNRKAPRHRLDQPTITPLTGIAENLSLNNMATRSVAASVAGVAFAATSTLAASGVAIAADVTPEATPQTNATDVDEFVANLVNSTSDTVVSLDVEWEAGDEVGVVAVSAEEVEAESAEEEEVVTTTTTATDTTSTQETQSETTETTTTTVSSSSVDTSSIVSAALSFVGVPYVYGGSSPSGFDCSGFTQYVYAMFGIDLPRTATAQGYAGTFISASEAQPGDLVWHSYGHVGIYIGNGQVVEATTPGSTVKVNNLWGNYSFVRVAS